MIANVGLIDEHLIHGGVELCEQLRIFFVDQKAVTLTVEEGENIFISFRIEHRCNVTVDVVEAERIFHVEKTFKVDELISEALIGSNFGHRRRGIIGHQVADLHVGFRNAVESFRQNQFHRKTTDDVIGALCIRDQAPIAGDFGHEIDLSALELFSELLPRFTRHVIEFPMTVV